MHIDVVRCRAFPDTALSPPPRTRTPRALLVVVSFCLRPGARGRSRAVLFLAKAAMRASLSAPRTRRLNSFPPLTGSIDRSLLPCQIAHMPRTRRRAFPSFLLRANGAELFYYSTRERTENSESRLHTQETWRVNTLLSWVRWHGSSGPCAREVSGGTFDMHLSIHQSIGSVPTTFWAKRGLLLRPAFQRSRNRFRRLPHPHHICEGKNGGSGWVSFDTFRRMDGVYLLLTMMEQLVF